jgi:uncharacterized protein YeaO (DUF488 family)
MIECKECETYVNGLFNRGEITKDEIEKVMLDRHILKGCAKKADPFKDWLDFAIENQEELKKENTMPYQFPEWNKGYLEALNDARERYNAATLTNEGTS